VTIPNLSGLTVQVAQQRLTTLGLVGNSPVCSIIDKVSNQIPAANTQVSKGDGVSLGCSKCSLTFCVDVKAVPIEAFALKTN
jgi:beta-lactam-binding protein with PASTA domain